MSRSPPWAFPRQSVAFLFCHICPGNANKYIAALCGYHEGGQLRLSGARAKSSLAGCHFACRWTDPGRGCFLDALSRVLEVMAHSESVLLRNALWQIPSNFLQNLGPGVPRRARQPFPGPLLRVPFLAASSLSRQQGARRCLRPAPPLRAPSLRGGSASAVVSGRAQQVSAGSALSLLAR